MENNITILGTGAYGIALSKMFYENKCNILMWTKFEEEKNEILEKHENVKVLPNVYIDEDIKITTNLEEAMNHSNIIVIAIPAAFVKSTMESLKQYLNDEKIIVIASKGLDIESGEFLSDIVNKYVKLENIIVLSGPSFAIDVVSKQPTGLTISGLNDNNVLLVKKCLQNKYLKLVKTNDIKGVEICGAVKNVMAIASGMLEGFNANPSCNAMFLTEAMHDIKDLLKDLECNERTIHTYAGFGDLLLTCTSHKSRNFTFGYKLVTSSKEELTEYRNNTTVEGLYTLDAIKKLIEEKNIKMPIIDVINGIVNEDKNPKNLLKYLMEKDI